MHVQASRCFRDVAFAHFKNPLDMFPAHPVCRHWILGQFGLFALLAYQRSENVVGMSSRRWRMASITSSPFPSPSRKSTTAYFGGLARALAMPSATVSAVSTLKPRVSIARDNRRRKGASSSTINRETSGPDTTAGIFGETGADGGASVSLSVILFSGRIKALHVFAYTCTI